MSGVLYVKVLVPKTISVTSVVDGEDNGFVLLAADGQAHPVSTDLINSTAFQKVWQAGEVQVSTDAAGLAVISGSLPGTVAPSKALDFIQGSVQSMARQLAGTQVDTMVSGDLYISYFTADQTITTTQVETSAAAVAASGGTLRKIGLYSVDALDNLTRIAATATDSALWGTVWTAFTKSWLAPAPIVQGQRYATAMLQVGSTGPALSGAYCLFSQSGDLPRICGVITSQTDLPATIAATSVQDSSSMIYSRSF